MEGIDQIKQIIKESNSICLIPSENEPEAVTSALALFYTLKELGKNVNLILDNLPKGIEFLVPSIDFITWPKNFVISIPRQKAEISQIYYEKQEKDLKIHLSSEKGQLKKEDISIYYKEDKPDLLIVIGVQSFKEYLENNLDRFGFLLESPILNIDNNQNNDRFGKVNLILENSISETTLDIINSIKEKYFDRQNTENQLRSPEKSLTANCLLTGLVSYYGNFANQKTSSKVFDICSILMNNGANLQEISANLNNTKREEFEFLREILKSLKEEDGVFISALFSRAFENFGHKEAKLAVEKIKTMGMQNDLIVVWQGHSSGATVKGFLYSKNRSLINRLTIGQNVLVAEDWLFLSTPGSDVKLVKDQIKNSII